MSCIIHACTVSLYIVQRSPLPIVYILVVVSSLRFLAASEHGSPPPLGAAACHGFITIITPLWPLWLEWICFWIQWQRCSKWWHTVQIRNKLCMPWWCIMKGSHWSHGSASDGRKFLLRPSRPRRPLEKTCNTALTVQAWRFWILTLRGTTCKCPMFSYLAYLASHFYFLSSLVLFCQGGPENGLCSLALGFMLVS